MYIATEQKRKKEYLELLRVICIGLVLLNHLPGYKLYMISSGYKQMIYLFVAMLTRINVPVFFMISGALLLGRTEQFSVILKKRVPRYICVILVFSLFRYLAMYITVFIKGGSVDGYKVNNFIRATLSGSIDGSYWFLYSYLGMLFALPFLQRIAKTLEKRDIYVILVLHFFISTCIPIINFFLVAGGRERIAISADFNIPMATLREFFYPLIGYYIDQNVDINSKRKKVIISILALTTVIALCVPSYLTYQEGVTTGEYTQKYVMLLDYVLAINIFVAIKWISSRERTQLVQLINKLALAIGPLTFGIYLFDPILKVFIWNQYNTWAESQFPTLIVSLGWIVISMICGGVLTFGLKKIKIFQKLL